MRCRLIVYCRAALASLRRFELVFNKRFMQLQDL